MSKQGKNSSKLKMQNLKPQLKTQNYSRFIGFKFLDIVLIFEI
jgi:hypothetical protein